jgi:hypothetical protein
MSSPASAWAGLCPHTIVVEKKTGRDAFGKPLYAGTPLTFQGRRSFKSQRIAARVEGGVAVDVISTSQICILGTPDLDPDDRVYVEGDTVFPQIVSWDKVPGVNGDHHVKVYMGSF